MIDITQVAEGLTAAKSGFDLFRSAIGLAKDAQGALPDEATRHAVSATLAQAERHVRLAEAELARALGYQLCRCEFPPTPMLRVGWRDERQIVGGKVLRHLRFDVHQCPLCHLTDARGSPYQREADKWPAKINEAAV